MNILVTTGSSGGHIYPAIGFVEALTEAYPDVVVTYVATSRACDKGYFSQGVSVVVLDEIVVSFRHCLRAIVVALNGVRCAFRTIRKLDPRVVVCFGSNISVPFALVAWTLRIPIVIHEQNAMFGKANAVLRFIATRIALSFTGGGQVSRSVYTGNVIRASLVSRVAGLSPKTYDETLNLLVMGGSQGAHFLNEAICELFEGRDTNGCPSFNVSVITGAEDVERVARRLRDCGVNARVYDFVQDMSEVYMWADCVIARAGGGVIAETLAFQLPAVYIPYPYAGGHQGDNARAIEQQGACVVINQGPNAVEQLATTLTSLNQSREQLTTMSGNAKAIRQVYAAQSLVEIVRPFV